MPLCKNVDEKVFNIPIQLMSPFLTAIDKKLLSMSLCRTFGTQPRRKILYNDLIDLVVTISVQKEALQGLLIAFNRSMYICHPTKTQLNFSVDGQNKNCMQYAHHRNQVKRYRLRKLHFYSHMLLPKPTVARRSVS